MKSAKDLLEDVPLPKANDLFLATAAATLGSGLLTVAKPEKMHDAYFTESDDDGATQVMHKPSTRWLGMSLCWVGAWNVAAALAPEEREGEGEAPARQRRGAPRWYDDETTLDRDRDATTTTARVGLDRARGFGATETPDAALVASSEGRRRCDSIVLLFP